MIHYNLPKVFICLLLTGALGEQILCPQPHAPVNGIVLMMNRQVDGDVTFICRSGYTLNGTTLLSCLPDGQWSGSSPTCEPTVCPKITTGAHGRISSTGNHFMDSTTIQCDEGFVLDGFGKVLCQADGQWSAPLGQCIQHPDNAYWLLLLLLLIPILIAIWIFSRKCCQQQRSPHSEVQLELEPLRVESRTIEPFNEGSYHCRLTLKEDFNAGNSDQYSTDYLTFLVKIEKAIEHTVQRHTGRTAMVLVHNLSQRRKEVIFDLRCPSTLSEKIITDAFTSSTLDVDNASFHVVPGTVHFLDEVEQKLALKIIENKHIKDKEQDTLIDLETEYVRLKIMTKEQMAEVGRDTIEVPDKYQADLEMHTGTEITDEEILKPGDVEKFILIRGRAGIGKTTLVQRSLLRWAHGEWATHMKAIFLLNLRILITIKTKLNLPDILSSCTRYGQIGVSVRSGWLERNQQHICIILDGIDELHNFKRLWDTEKAPTDLHEEEMPVAWGLSLLKRECLPHITLIVTSRPFTALSVLEEKATLLIELMGLTRERVIEFVDKNVPPDRRLTVKQTLQKSPILMSVCSITFYCTTLCQVLKEETHVTDSLRTYTLITAYIIKMFIQRSATSRISCDLGFLCQLAYGGLMKGTSRELPQLLFAEDDLEKYNLLFDDARVSEAEQAGLFLTTKVTVPKSDDNKVYLGQFVHLSIQEFLAMVGLLSQGSEEVKKTLRSLPMSGQFNMSLLFLYGLAFNTENEQIMILCSVLGVHLEVTDDIRDILIKNVQNISDDLQALQIIHESQSPEIAVKVGEEKFEKEIHFYGTKLTIVDVLALTFLLRHHHTATSIDLQGVGLDPVCIKELAEFLKDNNSIENVTIIDDGINYEAMTYLAKVLKENKSISYLKLGSILIYDNGVAQLAASLVETSTLQELVLDSVSITDAGVEALALTLRQSPALHLLRLSGYAMKEAGANAILHAVKTKKTASVTMWTPQCDEELKHHLLQTGRVNFKF